jgi:hypothetical protein
MFTLMLPCQALPFEVILWRAHFDALGRCTDAAMHRNPMFCSELGTNPQDILAIDALHTVYYGPVMRWASSVIWRVLLSNPWNLPGADGAVLETGVRMLRKDMLRHFEESHVPHDRRINDLTLKMLGEKRGCVVRGEYPHPGGGLKLKAAECGIAFKWAISMLRKDCISSGVLYRSELLSAGLALETWLAVTRSEEICLSVPECQELVDSAQRHLLHSRRAMVAFVPKSHFFAELSLRAYRMGNPRSYACFIDEGLNLILRELAANVHRTTQDERIFAHLQLIGRLNPNLCIWGTKDGWKGSLSKL